MKIDDCEVPAAALRHWKQAIAALPDATLADLGKANPSMQAGFRPGKVPPAQLRLRAQAMLDGKSGLPDALREVLSAAGLQGSLLCVLSEKAIEPQAAAWADAYGPQAFAAALLLDDRKPLRALGFRRFESLPGDEPGDDVAERARGDLVRAFKPFLTHLQPLVSRLAADEGPCVGSGVDGQDAKARASTTAPGGATESAPTARAPRPSAERELVLELRRQRQAARQLERQLKAVQDERDALATRLAATDSAHSQAKAELRALRAELQGTLDTIEQRVRQGVQAQLDARLRPWLAPAEALQRDVQALTDAALLDEAQALLQRQAQIDRREGLRSALVAELERTRQTLAEVQRAQQEALNPLSQLPAMAQRLQAHASDIQARLVASEARRGARVDSSRAGLEPADQGRTALSAAAGAKDSSALQAPIAAIAALHQAIAAAPTLDALATLRHQLQVVEPLGLMTPQVLADIHARMHDAASRLYDRASLHGRGTLEEAPGADDKSTAAEADLSLFPLQALQRTLAQGGGATLVVDGHNVLHQLPGLFRPVMHDHSLARRTLADRLLALAGRHPTLRIELWFDGPGQDTQTLNDQVRLHFSGGTGSDRADRAIVAQVRHLVEASDRSIYIVTADGQIDADGRRMGAAILLPQEIGLLL